MEWDGMERSGEARHGPAGAEGGVGLGAEWCVMAGVAGPGKQWQGSAGWATQGETRRGRAWQEWPGMARLGPGGAR